MSVGHELLINPSVILLDEPTSGNSLQSGTCILVDGACKFPSCPVLLALDVQTQG